MEKNIMTVLLDYFIIAAMTSIAASAIIGSVLTNLLIARFQKLIAYQNSRRSEVTLIPDPPAQHLLKNPIRFAEIPYLRSGSENRSFQLPIGHVPGLLRTISNAQLMPKKQNLPLDAKQFLSRSLLIYCPCNKVRGV